MHGPSPRTVMSNRQFSGRLVLLKSARAKPSQVACGSGKDVECLRKTVAAERERAERDEAEHAILDFSQRKQAMNARQEKVRTQLAEAREKIHALQSRKLRQVEMTGTLTMTKRARKRARPGICTACSQPTRNRVLAGSPGDDDSSV